MLAAASGLGGFYTSCTGCTLFVVNWSAAHPCCSSCSEALVNFSGAQPSFEFPSAGRLNFDDLRTNADWTDREKK